MSPNTLALLEHAESLLALGDRGAAAILLAAVLDLEPACLRAHNLRERHQLEGNLSDWTGVKAIISPEDDIFRFFVGHPHSRNPLRDYIADGWRTLSELHRLLDLVGRNLFRCPNFLEFAAGHGRFTRHLANAMAPGALSVSDVVPGCISFLRDHWAVKGFVSSSHPHDMKTRERYDIVFVLSLFSHLPESTWTPWLQRLYETVAPGGILIFSTHGEVAARMSKVALGESGFAFFPGSESSVLESSDYGTTFTSSKFVEGAIRTFATAAEILQVPTAFWSYQDAWIIQQD